MSLYHVTINTEILITILGCGFAMLRVDSDDLFAASSHHQDPVQTFRQGF